MYFCNSFFFFILLSVWWVYSVGVVYIVWMGGIMFKWYLNNGLYMMSYGVELEYELIFYFMYGFDCLNILSYLEMKFWLGMMLDLYFYYYFFYVFYCFVYFG